jgi:hypothetical protein
MSRRNLEIALTVLSVGFAVEGAVELYSLLTPGAITPGLGLLFLLPLLIAVVGLAFVWAGRDEWSSVHRHRAQTAASIFGVSILAGIVAAGVVALLVVQPSLGVPGWASALFAGSIAVLVLGTFVTYGYLVYPLTSKAGRVAVLGAILWSVGVSSAVGVVLSGDLSVIVSQIGSRTLTIPSFVGPVDALLDVLFVSFFLLLGAAVEADVAVARGLVSVPERPGAPPVRRGSPSPQGPARD